MDGLDFRQWCNGDDCGSDVTGNAFAESTHGGDRLYLRDAGRAAVRAALLFGDYPNTQQSMLLLCISPAVLGFFLGIEVQKRRLGSMGALASTINIIVLDNPMTFHFSQFLDSALGQIVGCVLAFTVILLVRDKSRDRTGRVLLNQFVSAAVSAMTTNVARRKENHLPALYQQLFLLMNKFPGICRNFARR